MPMPGFGSAGLLKAEKPLASSTANLSSRSGRSSQSANRFQRFSFGVMRAILDPAERLVNAHSSHNGLDRPSRRSTPAPRCACRQQHRLAGTGRAEQRQEFTMAAVVSRRRSPVSVVPARNVWTRSKSLETEPGSTPTRFGRSSQGMAIRRRFIRSKNDPCRACRARSSAGRETGTRRRDRKTPGRSAARLRRGHSPCPKAA